LLVAGNDDITMLKRPEATLASGHHQRMSQHVPNRSAATTAAAAAATAAATTATCTSATVAAKPAATMHVYDAIVVPFLCFIFLLSKNFNLFVNNTQQQQ